MKKGIVTLIGVVGVATVASAQTAGTFSITSSNVVDAMNPSTTISVWATWDGPLWLFAGGNYDLTSTSGGNADGTFGDETNVLNGPSSSAGTANGNMVTGAINGQVHFPSIGPPFLGSEDNPILLATYSWTTTDFSARTVGVDTSSTINFILALIETGAILSIFPDEFSAGSGNIEVVPAPSALALLGLGGLVATRRRR